MPAASRAVHRDDVGVPHAGEIARFGGEFKGGVEELQRDFRVELRIPGAIHDAERAFADLFEQAKVPPHFVFKCLGLVAAAHVGRRFGFDLLAMKLRDAVQGRHFPQNSRGLTGRLRRREVGPVHGDTIRDGGRDLEEVVFVRLVHGPSPLRAARARG